MTPEEQDLIQGLFNRLRSSEPAVKDREADALIARGVQTQPSAPYLLVQTVLVQEHALTNAQARIAELEKALEEAKREQPSRQTAGSSSFLGGLISGGPWGRKSEDAQPQPQRQPIWNNPTQTGHTPAGVLATYGQPQAYAPPANGGFLRSALTTAAGVAGGALLFQGISNLIGHNAGPFSSGLAEYSQTATPEIVENVTNNYYGTELGSADSGIAPDSPWAQAQDVQNADYAPDDGGGFDGGGFDDGGFA